MRFPARSESNSFKYGKCRFVPAGLLAGALLFAAPSVFGWGVEGHHVAARIAWANLNQNAKSRVRALLAANADLVSISTWADEVRRDRKETYTWHFVDIPLGAARSGISRFCPPEGCVFGKIDDFVAVLKNPASSPERQTEALKFLVHFVGDLHQPLHCGERNDRGGNDQKVIYFGRETNLHRIWDTDILVKMNLSEDTLASELMAAMTESQRRQWQKGSVEDWAFESKELSRTVVYQGVPAGSTAVLGEKYEARAEPVVKLQLSRAGIRLAMILNSIWQ